jgi:hypothetical protein
MTTQIFKLKNLGQAAHAQMAERICAHLEAMGFGCEHLDDSMYRVAEEISHKLLEEFGTSTAQRLAEQEFAAAEEVNQHSMVDQLIVLRQSCANNEAFAELLGSALRIDSPEALLKPSELI